MWVGRTVVRLRLVPADVCLARKAWSSGPCSYKDVLCFLGNNFLCRVLLLLHPDTISHLLHVVLEINTQKRVAFVWRHARKDPSQGKEMLLVTVISIICYWWSQCPINDNLEPAAGWLFPSGARTFASANFRVQNKIVQVFCSTGTCFWIGRGGHNCILFSSCLNLGLQRGGGEASPIVLYLLVSSALRRVKVGGVVFRYVARQLREGSAFS